MDSTDQYEQVCRQEFAEIKATLARIDKALRGNGDTPGVMERVRVLERSESRRGKLAWAVIGSAAAAVAFSVIRSLLEG